MTPTELAREASTWGQQAQYWRGEMARYRRREHPHLWLDRWRRARGCEREFERVMAEYERQRPPHVYYCDRCGVLPADATTADLCGRCQNDHDFDTQTDAQAVEEESHD